MLRGHCEAVGRDYDDIEKTVMMRLPVRADGSGVDESLAELQRLAGLGVQHVHGLVREVSSIRPLEVYGEQIIPVAAGF